MQKLHLRLLLEVIKDKVKGDLKTGVKAIDDSVLLTRVRTAAENASRAYCGNSDRERNVAVGRAVLVGWSRSEMALYCLCGSGA